VLSETSGAQQFRDTAKPADTNGKHANKKKSTGESVFINNVIHIFMV